MLDTIRGLVRPVVTTVGFFAITAGFFLGKVPADIYVPMVTGMVTWWFASRPANHTPPTP